MGVGQQWKLLACWKRGSQLVKKKIFKAFFSMGVAFGALVGTSTAASAYNIDCNLQAQTCEEYVSQANGTVMAYLWGYNSTGDYWLIKSIHFGG
jgi:hypothetical protein